MARITKKDIYASFGIEYNTKTQKIKTPYGWTRELLKKGNSKVGAHVKTWSMNTSTCCCHCEGCYGERGCYRFASVKKALALNTDLARNELSFWTRAIMAQLATLKPGTEIRIHCVGDFFSLEYVNAWHEIIKAYPGLIFWTYTKTQYESAFDDLDNANIVKSIVNGKLNFGHCEHVMELYEELTTAGESVHICRCGVDDDQHCEGCHKCSISKFVLFLEHSTGYDAKSDPLYETLAEIINNQ